jgi:hypothetical protein
MREDTGGSLRNCALNSRDAEHSTKLSARAQFTPLGRATVVAWAVVVCIAGGALAPAEMDVVGGTSPGGPTVEVHAPVEMAAQVYAAASMADQDRYARGTGLARNALLINMADSSAQARTLAATR